MFTFYYPLEVMQLRDQGLASEHSATFGRVRNNNTRNHQGWDLTAPVGTRCYAVAAGTVEFIRNSGAYGLQLGLGFNRDGSTDVCDTFLVAFYAHLQPGSIQVAVGSNVTAGQFVARTGTSGNASANAPHLHFEIRTVNRAAAGLGLNNRIDPGQVLGYDLYQSQEDPDQCGRSPVRIGAPGGSGQPTPVVR